MESKKSFVSLSVFIASLHDRHHHRVLKMTTQKPVVHIEVCLRPLTNLSKVPQVCFGVRNVVIMLTDDQIQREIVEWLRTDFLYLILKRELDDFSE